MKTIKITAKLTPVEVKIMRYEKTQNNIRAVDIGSNDIIKSINAQECVMDEFIKFAVNKERDEVNELINRLKSTISIMERENAI